MNERRWIAMAGAGAEAVPAPWSWLLAVSIPWIWSVAMMLAQKLFLGRPQP